VKEGLPTRDRDFALFGSNMTKGVVGNDVINTLLRRSMKSAVCCWNCGLALRLDFHQRAPAEHKSVAGGIAMMNFTFSRGIAAIISSIVRIGVCPTE
jgi:hypothetical protein